jgi:hypothetical protein
MKQQEMAVARDRVAGHIEGRLPGHRAAPGGAGEQRGGTIEEAPTSEKSGSAHWNRGHNACPQIDRSFRFLLSPA